ncbi:MAG: hypothetical protein ABIS45_02995, partial [Burkholderiales bacterium]
DQPSTCSVAPEKRRILAYFIWHRSRAGFAETQLLAEFVGASVWQQLTLTEKLNDVNIAGIV